MPFRNRLQFQPWLSVVLLLAIGFIGRREPAGETATTEGAALRKAGAVFSTVQGRDTRFAARKTPVPGGPLVDFMEGDGLEISGSFRSTLAENRDDQIATPRCACSTRERAPPRAA